LPLPRSSGTVVATFCPIAKGTSMTRLGVITDEISEDFEHALSACTELGIRDIELRSLWNTSIVDQTDDDLRRIERMIVDGGFNVCGIASPFLKCHVSGEGEAAGRTHSASTASRDEQWDVLARSLQVANRLDAPMVRAFSFWRVEDPTSVREDLLAVLQEATVRTKAAGKLLGLENEYACNIATGEEAAWYLERIDDPTLGLIWDPGNIAALGVQPTADDYGSIADRVLHVHVKDAVSLDLGDGFTVIGDGVVGWDEQLRLLAAQGYDGVLSLETHFALDGDHEAGTRACAAALRELATGAGVSLPA
jgi:L-ribulose-5-phosphate 3-epimerase